ncbi:MAG: hypothetical protein HKL95_07230 [Phycisphaerae bacterium]|nr:hypothetical protein [Phycisphaerae bacterium]
MNTAVYLHAWISVDTDRTPLVLGWGGGTWEGVQRPTTKAANLACDAAQALLVGITADHRDGGGVFIGSTTGSLHDDLVFDESRVVDGGQYPSPNAFRRTLPSTIASEITIDLGLHGPVVVYAAGAASAAVACVRGIEYVRRGIVPMAIVGAMEIWTGAPHGGMAKAQVPAGAEAFTPRQTSAERCQIVLALIGSTEIPHNRPPLGQFAKARLGGSDIHLPGQMDRSLKLLVDLLVAGQGRMEVDGAVGIKAVLELQRP